MINVKLINANCKSAFYIKKNYSVDYDIINKFDIRVCRIIGKKLNKLKDRYIWIKK